MKKRFNTFFKDYQSQGTFFFATVFAALGITALAGAAFFFVFVNRPEQVLVPDVTRKELTAALLELQVKELYPKIQLRYSNTRDDKGLVLEQNPGGGSIVKAERRITLVVSRGLMVDTLSDFTGRQLSEVRLELQTLFSGAARPLITLGEPSYTPDIAEAGIILAQEPPPETPITDPVTVKLIVSRGPQFEQAAAPDLAGMTIQDVYRQMERSKVIFDFSARPAGTGDRPGTVVSQEESPPSVPIHTRVQAELALPAAPLAGNIYGIFAVDLPAFPYAIPVQLMIRPPSGAAFPAVSFEHTGGPVTIPYAAPPGSELILVSAGRTLASQIVQ
jgi:beta-lactam-binding protein with PASTA domain